MCTYRVYILRVYASTAFNKEKHNHRYDTGQILWLTAFLPLDGQDSGQGTPYIKTSMFSLERPWRDKTRPPADVLDTGCPVCRWVPRNKYFTPRADHDLDHIYPNPSLWYVVQDLYRMYRSNLWNMSYCRSYRSGSICPERSRPWSENRGYRSYVRRVKCFMSRQHTQRLCLSERFS